MKAAFYRGDSRFSVDEIPPPPRPAPSEVQINVAFCGICGTDLHVYHGHMDKRVGFERIIGHEMSGFIDSVGQEVDNLAKGDLVVVRPLLSCGECPACKAGHAHICHRLNFVGLDSNGAFQQKWNVQSSIVHKIPPGLDAEAAALVEPMAVACHSTRRARLASGEDVVVIGGGPIGLVTALVARSKGAKVTIAEISDYRRAFAEKLGFALAPADKTECITAVMDQTGGKGADVVFEVTGSQPGADMMTELVAARGRIGLIGVHPERRLVDMYRFFWRELELIGSRVYEPQDFDDAIAYIADNSFLARELITDVRPLASINEAFAGLAGNPMAIKSLLSLGGAQ